MQDLNSDEVDEAEGTVFRDVIMLALLGFVTFVVLLLPHVNPPIEAKETGQTPGDMIVEIRWPDELDTDVDLWVEAPGDRPVGYSNRGGLVFNLLRDDLGHSSDLTKLNYEFAYTRGAPAGEYTVNVHLYRNMSKLEHIPISVVVSLRNDQTRSTHVIASENVLLTRVGQERTVVRFAIAENGYLVPGSTNYIFKPLRSGWK